ncbi:MAG: helix-turn-helix domain-containing protein, partial [Gammaproteobacteria bacterium]
MFLIPVGDVTYAEIEDLIVRQVPESDRVEFKGHLPGDGAEQRWNESRDIDRAAKKKLLGEVVALANSYGGYVVVGIEESDMSPPTAAHVNNIADAADLAGRLERSAGDLVSPHVIGLRFLAICPDQGSDGVVVIHVPRSRLAPHRLELNKECYVRRGEESVRMTMREIRDMSILAERLDSLVDRSIFDLRTTAEARRRAITTLGAAGKRFVEVVAVPADPER